MAVIQGNAHKSSVTGFYPLNIEQSLRFNDDDSAYLSRTPASAGNRKTWTWSGWVKRGNIKSARIDLFSSDGSTPTTNMSFGWNSSDQLFFGNWSSDQILVSTQVFRDPSAWYHIVVQFDSTQATASDRVKFYINGSRLTAVTDNISTYISQNTDYGVNDTSEHNIGQSAYANNFIYDGYLAEVHFTDGTAYDADAFGEFKSGVWVAKSPSVTYGTNGFYLDFANSADIGNDVSGEGNDWTPNNFTASDVVLDSPTDNYATLNPLSKGNNVTLSDGNLLATSGSPYSPAVSTIGVSSGKYYVEAETLASNLNIGITAQSHLGTTEFLGQTSDSWCYATDGNIYNGGSAVLNTGTTYTVGDVIGLALDMDAGNMYVYKNGTAVYSGNAVVTGLSGTFYIGVGASNSTMKINFGQLGFTYTPPTGYLALSTANLPEPTISPADDASPSDYFNTVIWTGNGTTQSINVGFQPDFVWHKTRSTSNNHVLLDAIRGEDQILYSNLTNSEASRADSIHLTSTGFDLEDSWVNRNGSGITYVAWNWKANGSGVSNTDGTITSTVSANTTSGFSIVSYTGDGSGSADVGHGLTSVDLMILKERTDGVGSSSYWRVTDRVTASQGFLQLTNAFTAITDGGGNGSIDPETLSSTTFGFKGSSTVNNVNASGADYIAYCFHSVEGFSKFGSYTGNGSADGSFVYCGFRPSYLTIKRTSGVGSWETRDSTRQPVNDGTRKSLFPSSSSAEISSSDAVDFLSNGFKIRTSDIDINNSGDSYIFMAFAENPFRYSLAR